LRATEGVCKDNLRFYIVAFRVCRSLRRRNPLGALKDVLAMVIFWFLWAVYWDASKALEPTLKRGQPSTKFLFKSVN
jgi:hypothetical protein